MDDRLRRIRRQAPRVRKVRDWRRTGWAGMADQLRERHAVDHDEQAGTVPPC